MLVARQDRVINIFEDLAFKTVGVPSFDDLATYQLFAARAEAMDYSVKIEAVYRKRNAYWLNNVQSNAQEPLNLLVTEDIQSGVHQVKSECKA